MKRLILLLRISSIEDYFFSSEDHTAIHLELLKIKLFRLGEFFLDVRFAFKNRSL